MVYYLKVVSLENKNFRAVVKKYYSYDQYIAKYLLYDIQLLLTLPWEQHLIFFISSVSAHGPLFRDQDAHPSCSNMWGAQS